MKKQVITALGMLTAGMLSVSAFAADAEKEITILYTNDVHTYINNQHKNENDEMVQDLSYGNVKAYYDDLVAEGKQVILVDAGDHSQGTAFGAMDEAKSIIDIMNATGYQVATLGNHEFDYGMFRTFGIIDQADFPYISCDFYSVEDENLVLPPYEVFDMDGVKVAFVGITTPESITSSTPAYFMDEKKERYLYQIYRGDDGQELYDSVQAAIDEAAKEADYVIGLGHLGVDPSNVPYTSEEVIANTSGFDAFIDGHSHTTMEQNSVMDKDGNSVVLTQTGSYFANIGEMTIAGDTITTKLISEYDRRDETVDAMVQNLVASVDEQLNVNIAIADNGLYSVDPETELRLVRRQETNLGDFAADAVYYHFNVVEDIDCDMAIVNGGGIRTDIPAGEISYKLAKTVHPFGNVICMIEATGQDILDELEWTSRETGMIAEDGTPAELGAFTHVAGIVYTVDTTIESTVQSDDDFWIGGPTGEYRVRDVKIYNKETDTYEPLDLEHTYTIGGINYILRNSGGGCSMFDDNKVVKDYVGEDYLIMAEYASAFTKDESDNMPHIATKNSPLKCYENYLLDYENVNGAGRITLEE